MFYTISLQNAPQVGGTTFTMGIDAAVTQCSWSTTIAGGFGVAKVGMMDLAQPQYGYLPQPIDVKPLGHVEIRDSGAGRVVFAGRITKLDRVSPSGGTGNVRGFEATGYGIAALDDNYYTSSDVTNTTSGAVLLDVLKTGVPLLKPATGTTFWQDPGITMTRASVSQTQVSQIVQQVCQAAGNALNSVYDFTVWENFAAWLQPRVAPAQPTYEIPYDSGITDWTDDYTLACSNVVARYTPAGGSATLTSPTTFAQTVFLNTYGFTRTTLIDCGTTTATFAAAVAAAYQTLHAGPETSVEVTRTHREMETPGGGSRPASQVRAGEWVRIGDDAAQGNPDPFIIVSTEYDGNRRELKATLGYQPRTFWGVINRALNTVRAVQRAASPISGARTAAG